MAAKTPVTVDTAGYVDITRGLPEAPATPASTDVIATDYTLAKNRSRYITELYYFSNIDDTDTWASGISGIQIVFTADSASQADNDNSSGRLTSAAGQVTFNAEAIDAQCYVLLFIDPVVSGRSGVRGL